MRSRTAKILIILVIYAMLHVVQACCGNRIPYYDYTGLEVEPYTETSLFPGDTLHGLHIRPSGISAVASNYELTVSTAAFGTSCGDQGADGDKYEITDLEITTEPAFHDTLPAGADLKSIFILYGDTTRTLTQWTRNLRFYGTADFVGGIALYTRHRPQISGQEFTVNVKVTKSDGSTAQGTASGIRFD